MNKSRWLEAIRQGCAPGALHSACVPNFDLGGDSPPPPDYSSIAEANTEAAKMSKEAADADLAFRKQQYADSKPATDRLVATSQTIADQQVKDSADASSRASSSWDRWTNVGIPEQDRMVADANNYGSESDQELQAGRAISDVRQQSKIASENATRSLEAMGINPNSGRFASLAGQVSTAEAASAAGAATTARVQARDKGIGLRAGASAALAGQPNIAGQQAGLSTNSGNAAVGAASAGSTAGLPMASYVSGGVNNQITANGQTIQGNLGVGNLMNEGYGIQSRADTASSAGMGQAIGGIATAAAYAF